MKGRLGVRTQVLLTVVGVLAAGLAVVYQISGSLIQGTVKEAHIEREKMLAGALAQDLSSASNSPDGVTAKLNAWRKSFERLCIAVVTDSGPSTEVVESSLKRCLPKTAVVNLLKEKSNRQSAHIVDFDGEPALAVITSIPSALLGSNPRLITASSMQTVMSRIDQTRDLMLLFSLLAVLLMCVIIYLLLTLLIVRPMAKMIRAIENVRDGNLDSKVSPAGGRELRELAAAFNELTQALQVNRAEISDQIEELEDINEELASTHRQLVQSEKLASIGTLAAGVAHEIGNPIAIVLGYLEMLQREDILEEERGNFIRQATDATHRINATIRDLLDFSKPEDTNDIAPANVGDVVEQSLKLLRPQIRFRHAEVIKDLSDESVLAAIAERRLQQLLINVLLNAADATVETEGGGTIEVTLGVEEETAVIRIRDNGAGIGDDVKSRAFDPFFTTKEPGKGTGLGLSVCYSIVETCGGRIQLTNRKDHRGTEVTIELPVASQVEASDMP